MFCLPADFTSENAAHHRRVAFDVSCPRRSERSLDSLASSRSSDPGVTVISPCPQRFKRSVRRIALAARSRRSLPDENLLPAQSGAYPPCSPSPSCRRSASCAAQRRASSLRYLALRQQLSGAPARGRGSDRHLPRRPAGQLAAVGLDRHVRADDQHHVRKRASLRSFTLFRMLQAASMAITVVLPAPVAILQAYR